MVSYRIAIRRSGYSFPLKWLLEKGIVARHGIFPFGGYGESFIFTKQIEGFRLPERFTITNFKNCITDAIKQIKEMMK